MIEPHYGDRGLMQFERVGRENQAKIRIIESSEPSKPMVWLVSEPGPDLSEHPCPCSDEVAVQLSIEEVTELRDQLSFLIEHHHHRAGRGDDPR